MSFYRFVYYCAVVGGWAALLAGLPTYRFVVGNPVFGPVQRDILGAAILGGAVAFGLNLLAGISNFRWRQQLHRALAGLLGGAVGGALGTAIYRGIGLPQFLGWAVMGMAIGCVEGIYERSPAKIRNGLLGGIVGGLLGGSLLSLISGNAGSSGGIIGFCILGISIGASIGLAQVVFKEAWVTVLDGFRPGRQLILSQPVTVLGRGDHLPLPFLGYAGRDLENEHLRISRQPQGQFVLEDNRSRIGTLLNGKRVSDPISLGDGDLIKFGGNIVRFNQRGRTVARDAAVRPAAAVVPTAPPLPPLSSVPPFMSPAARITPPAENRPSAAHPRIPSPPPPPPVKP